MVGKKSGKLLVYSSLQWVDAVFELRVAGPWQAAGWTLLDGNSINLGAADAQSADAILIHRNYPAFCPDMRDIFRFSLQSGIPLIYETDDLLTDLPPTHLGHLFYESVREKLVEAMRVADAVIVSTDQLRDQMQIINPRVHVVPNYLHDQIWSFKPVYEGSPDATITIGYCGQSSHRHDIDAISPALKRVLESSDQRVKITFFGISPPPDLRGLAQVNWKPFDLGSYKEFAELMSAQDCDIFLAPLQDNQFNRCKSAIKFLEIAALGKAGLYSNLCPYAKIVQEGRTGLLAATLDEWYQQLMRLTHDSEFRAGIARESQNYVRESLLLSGKGDELDRQFEQIVSEARVSSRQKGTLGAAV